LFSARVAGEFGTWGLAELSALEEGFYFEQESSPGTYRDVFAGSAKTVGHVATDPKADDQIGGEANHPGVAAVVAQAWVASERKVEAQITDLMRSTSFHYSLEESRYD
jgi:hypothetical protein